MHAPVLENIQTSNVLTGITGITFLLELHFRPCHQGRPCHFGACGVYWEALGTK
jgi:hypothetical protein